MKKLMLVIFMLFITTADAQAHLAFNVRAGLKHLENGRLEDAEKELQLARFADPNNPLIKYNLGQICYRKRDYAGAAKLFADVAESTNDKELGFMSLHNLGNAAYRMGNYAMAVEAYKRGLKIKHEPKTEFNLRQAEKKLQEQIEQQQNQQNQQTQRNQQQQDKQNQSDQNQHNQQQQNQGQQNLQQQNLQNQSQQNQNGKKEKIDNQQQAKNNDASQKQNEQNKKDSSVSEQMQANKGTDKEKGKDSEQVKPDEQQNTSQDRRQDVEMAQENADSKKPQESQRARAIKNRKMNPYMIEKLMREMQEREKQAQLYYRNDQVQRQEEMDPFNMNAQQLREFFLNRGRKPRKQQSEEPDW